MKKKYTFEQVVRLLKKHAGDYVPYEFEYTDDIGNKQRASGYIGGMWNKFFIEFSRQLGSHFVDDPRPYCRDGWELVRPAKVKRERVKVGNMAYRKEGTYDVKLSTMELGEMDYDLYAVKR